LLANYQDVVNSAGRNDIPQTYQYDFAVIKFARPVANGRRLSFSTERKFLTATYKKTLVGYAAESHSGDFPYALTSSNAFFQSLNMYYVCPHLYVEGGMSGGPLISYTPSAKVLGVIVSRDEPPFGGVLAGVRLLDDRAKQLIKSLK